MKAIALATTTPTIMDITATGVTAHRLETVSHMDLADLKHGKGS